MKFVDEILTSNCDSISRDVVAKWTSYLEITNENVAARGLDELQRKFFYLLEQKMEHGLSKEVEDAVLNELKDWYDTDSLEDPIRLQAVDLDDIHKGIWQLLYEDDSEDPLVHVYFKGWEIDYLAVTG